MASIFLSFSRCYEGCGFEAETPDADPIETLSTPKLWDAMQRNSILPSDLVGSTDVPCPICSRILAAEFPAAVREWLRKPIPGASNRETTGRLVDLCLWIADLADRQGQLKPSIFGIVARWLAHACLRLPGPVLAVGAPVFLGYKRVFGALCTAELDVSFMQHALDNAYKYEAESAVRLLAIRERSAGFSRALEEFKHLFFRLCQLTRLRNLVKPDVARQIDRLIPVNNTNTNACDQILRAELPKVVDNLVPVTRSLCKAARAQFYTPRKNTGPELPAAEAGSVHSLGIAPYEYLSRRLKADLATRELQMAQDFRLMQVRAENAWWRLRGASPLYGGGRLHEDQVKALTVFVSAASQVVDKSFGYTELVNRMEAYLIADETGCNVHCYSTGVKI